MKRELIKKHLEGWSGISPSSVSHYLETGAISGSLLIAIEQMLGDYLKEFQRVQIEQIDKYINSNPTLRDGIIEKMRYASIEAIKKMEEKQ